MSDWQTTAREAAQRNGIDPDVFVRQIQQESGGRDVTSNAGAEGPGQFMPGTARQVGLNSTTVHELGPSLDAAAKLVAQYSKQYGGIRNALIAYNAGPGAVGRANLPAETQHYIATILGHGGASPAPGSGTTTSAPAMGSSAGAPQDAGQAGDFTSLLGSLLAPKQQTPQSTPLAAPAFAAHPVLPQGAAPMQAQTPAPPQDGVSASLGLLEALRGTAPTPDPSQPSGVAATVFAQRAQGGVAGAVKAQRAGRAVISPHARPGDPVVAGKQSVGGEHATDGLAGFPARDYFAPAGSHAVAPVSGTVIRLSGHDPANGPTNGPHGPLGWSVYIKGDDGRTYFLTHMGSRDVKAGQTVQQGQVIGTVADYDKYGTPSHIHQGVSGG